MTLPCNHVWSTSWNLFCLPSKSYFIDGSHAALLLKVVNCGHTPNKQISSGSMG